MQTAKLDRWLLVNYSGYPYAPNSFMPDNGLAGLAGALLADGREPLIHDLCTVETLRALSSPAMRARLTRAWSAAQRPAGGLSDRFSQLVALAGLARCGRERQRLQRGLLERTTRDLLDLIRRRGVQAVGFKLWNGDGMEGSLFMARAVRREFPGIRIFGGGPMVDCFMETLLERYPYFDAFAFGEAEESIRLLAERGGSPETYAAIPNLVYRADGKVRRSEERPVADLNSLPQPAYDAAVYPAMEGNGKIRIIVVDESRGCRNNCAFCIHPVKSNHGLRLKSIDRLMGEVTRFADQYGTRTFRFAGSCTPYSLLHEFAAEVIRRGLQVTYTSFAHIRGGESADFATLRRSGCLSLFFGIESGSQRVLDKMRKGVRVEQVPRVIRRAREAGIFTVGSLIFPAPGDTPETEAETLALLGPEKPDAITAQAPVVAPRTDWFENPERYGIAFADRNLYIDEALTWKLNLLLPPAFWKNMPVTIDGRGYKAVLAETGRFVRRLEQAGFMTAVSDDTYLMCCKTGDPIREFRDRTRLAFFSGDVDAIEQMIDRVNAGV